MMHFHYRPRSGGLVYYADQKSAMLHAARDWDAYVINQLRANPYMDDLWDDPAMHQAHWIGRVTMCSYETCKGRGHEEGAAKRFIESTPDSKQKPRDVGDDRLRSGSARATWDGR